MDCTLLSADFGDDIPSPEVFLSCSYRGGQGKLGLQTIALKFPGVPGRI